MSSSSLTGTPGENLGRERRLRTRTGKRRNFRRAMIVLFLGTFFVSFPLATQTALGNPTATPEELHLSWENSSDHMTVTWITDTLSSHSQVRYGKTYALEEGYRNAVTGGVPHVPSLYLHRAMMGPLTPGSLYHYSVGDNATGWSRVRDFSSTPAGTVAFTFVATGDMDVTSEAQANVLRMAEVTPAFALHAGDLSYAEKDQTKWDAWFRQIQPLAAMAAYMPAIGNHEYEGDPDLASYLSRFALPNNKRYYSFNYSNVHVISLDSGPIYQTPDGAVTSWLEADLKYNSRDPVHPWVVVFLHFPPFASGAMHSWMAGRKAWSPLFDKYGVELVISGHDHDYERSWPVNATGSVAQWNYSRPRVPVYVVTGGGGALLLRFPSGPQPSWSAFRVSTYETLRIRVQGANMTVLAIAPNGTLIDGFTITHPPVPPVVSIMSPGEGSMVNTGGIKVSGTAVDAGGGPIERVEVRVNDGPWTEVKGISPWMAWVDLRRGPNVIQARARDRSGGTSAIDSASVYFGNEVLGASFTITPSRGDVATFFTADASTSYDREVNTNSLQVRWDWGDDGGWDTPWSTGKVAEHRFLEPGNYRIRLEVSDLLGRTGTTARWVVVSPHFLVSASANPAWGVAPLRVALTSSLSGGLGPYSYAWDFGDGDRSASQNVTHTYRRAGTFTVTLIVRDAEGRTVSTSTQVEASSPLDLVGLGIPPWVLYAVAPGGFAVGVAFVLWRRHRKGGR